MPGLPNGFFSVIVEETLAFLFLFISLLTMSSTSLKGTVAGFLALVLVTAGAGCSPVGTTTTTVAVGPTGMFKSDDGGEKWREINALPTSKGVQSLNKLKIYRAFTDPSDPDALFVQGAAQNRAKAICLACHVRTECLADRSDLDHTQTWFESHDRAGHRSVGGALCGQVGWTLMVRGQDPPAKK